MSKDNEQLKSHVESIAEDITSPKKEDYEDGEICGHEYLNDALSIEYVISSDGSFLGAEVLVTFGGPNIVIDTRKELIIGNWWGSHATARFTDNLGLHDILEDYYYCTIGSEVSA